MCALALLGHTKRGFPAVEFVEKAPPGVSAQAEAYVLNSEKRMVLITSTWAFRQAREAEFECGRIEALQEIAGVLAHEEWHLRHGTDEQGAYDAQLTALLAAGADQNGALFHNVMRAKQKVMNAAKRRVETGTFAGRDEHN
ncbi:MAG TPA: hypothetical protein VLV86_08915 [Vicinamibacterales bacterium]|nr:hypothetical protein [Vicinamibacterales bacterium]